MENSNLPQSPQAPTPSQVREAPRIVISKSTKSMGISLVLTAIFGPIGMFYSSIVGAIIMMVVYLIIGLITFGFGWLFLQPICMIWGALAVNRYNNKLLEEANM